MAPTPVAAPARSSPAADLDRLAIDTIRTLSMDAVEAATKRAQEQSDQK